MLAGVEDGIYAEETLPTLIVVGPIGCRPYSGFSVSFNFGFLLLLSTLSDMVNMDMMKMDMAGESHSPGAGLRKSSSLEVLSGNQ